MDSETTRKPVGHVRQHEVAEIRVDQDAPRNPYVSGYGPKIPTRYMLKMRDGNRWHRVYMVQYGNSGSAYITHKGQDKYLDPYVEGALEDAAAELWKAEELAAKGIAPYSDTEVELATTAALHTLLWVSTDDDGDPMDDSHTPEDFPPELREGMRKLIAAFMESNLETLVQAGFVAGPYGHGGEDKMGQIGHDYVLTTGGHGAGFWDRGLGEPGDKLTEACRADRHEWHVYVNDDGVLWCDDLNQE